MTESCVFCQIAAGAAPASVVYRDDEVIAFLDLHPVHAGHTLVAPRAHAADVRHCSPELAARLFEVSARLAPAIVEVTEADGFNVWTAAGRAAGQTVFHAHLHVLPRFVGDAFGPQVLKGHPHAVGREELDTMAARIRAVGTQDVTRRA